MRNSFRILLIAIFAASLAVSALAHDKHKHDAKTTGKQEKAVAGKAAAEFLGKGDGVETCPVTGEAITNKDNKAVFFGRTVYFCCAGCLAEARKNPALYVKKTHQEQLAALKAAPKPADHHDHAAMAAGQDAKPAGSTFLGKGDGVETCPVTGEPVNKNVKAEINGKTVYACCDDCLAKVKKNPELYLKEFAPKAQAFLGKGDGIETCPVTGEPVNKELKAEVMGRTVYVCCAGCLEKLKKNPELYLKK